VIKVRKTIQFGQHSLVLETGEMARQADGAVFASMNGTQVLVTVVGKKGNAEKNDYFQLGVRYQEKTYAAGKIPGGFNKREGRPSDHETLVSRLIDRPIRPLFPAHFLNEVQVVATVVSLNPEVPADIVALIGASAALAISGLPFQGPIGAVRVGYADGVYLLNPGPKALATSMLDLVVAGTESALLMVESEAKELSEEIMRGAMAYGHEMMQGVIKEIKALAAEVNRAPWVIAAPVVSEALEQQVKILAAEKIKTAYLQKDKVLRHQLLGETKQAVLEVLRAENEMVDSGLVDTYFHNIEKTTVREQILSGEPRIDGRDLFTVRPITIRTGLLDRAHGSTLFTRGETQALVAVTLGSERDAQTLDKLDGEIKDRFMLHYNFPPYSVGETGMMGSPKRREIGHGRLARRALQAVLPDAKAFPYVLRVVSEITESNGSSSMATVCGASLALMDAGVPIQSTVAGVAMGLIKDGDRFAVLTDILGDEDHLGDMDFKVAGTKRGITALQMDMKIDGITQPILEKALDQALSGRLHILGVMENALSAHRETLSEHAPRIVTMKVAEDKIRSVIGKGGATIKGITESTGVTVDIDDTGVVRLFSPDAAALEEAQRQIRGACGDVKVGETYRGKVTKIMDFGAFINLLPGKDGLLHISKICTDRNQKVESVLEEGQEVEVYVAGLDKQGRVQLEWKEKMTIPPVAAPASESVALVEAHVEVDAEIEADDDGMHNV